MYNIKEQDLVMLRLPNDLEFDGRQRHYNTWFRVMFVDTDETFIGKCEKIDNMDFTLYKKEQNIKLDIKKIQHVYKICEKFCYSDGITLCECPGLCRNNM